MAQKEKLKKLYPPSGGPIRGVRFSGRGLIALGPTKVTVREPLLRNRVQLNIVVYWKRDASTPDLALASTER